MKIIFGKRQSGRTTKLIETAAENGYPILVKNSNEQAHLNYKVKKMGLSDKVKIIKLEDVHSRGRIITHVNIDDAEWLLQQLLDVRIASMTICTKDPNIESINLDNKE